MRLLDIYHATRQKDGRILNGIDPNPNTIPIIVIRYNTVDMSSHTAFIHDDVQKVELNGKLYDYNHPKAQLPLSIAAKHTPNPQPNPQQWIADSTTISIVKEIDQEIINNLRKTLGQKDPPTEFQTIERRKDAERWLKYPDPIKTETTCWTSQITTDENGNPVWSTQESEEQHGMD